ncbi:MAG TPA: hypothetical protein PKV66_01050, partial [Candidatus Pelethenecus sp.]|nr:hypothetical protein [Candidatus Pelethenecus sp.]
MDIKAFREYLISEINSSALEECVHKEHKFIEYVCDMLKNDYGKINNELDGECFIASTIGNKAFKSMQLDAADVDLVTNTINLMICDFNESEMSTLNTEVVNSKAQKMLAFCENCLKGYYNNNA